MPESEFQRLHPATFLVVLASIVRRFLIPGAIVFFFGGWPGEILVMWFSVPVFLWAGYRFFATKIAIGDDELLIREGLTGRSLRRIPMDRIRSIETRRGLVHRVFDIDDVVVHTGSGSEAEATLSAVGRDTVARLREAIAKIAIREPREGKTGAARPRLWRCSPLDLIGYGMIYNRGWLVLAIGFGLAWQMDLATWDIYHQGYSYSKSVFGSSIVSIGMTLLAGMVALWVALRIFSVVSALITFYGFTVRDEGDQVHLSYGSLFKRDLSLPERRFHVIQIDEGPLHRLMGRVTLSAWTAGTWSGEDGEDDENSQWNAYFNSLLLHPLADRAQARDMIAGITGESDWQTLEWRDLHPNAFARILTHGLFLAPVCAVITYFWLGWGLFSFIVLAWLTTWDAWVTAKHAKYAVTGQGVWHRQGYFKKQWRMVGLGHIQSLERVESPFDRRGGTAKLRIDTPTAPSGFHAISIGYIPKAQADQIHRQLAAVAAQTEPQY